MAIAAIEDKRSEKLTDPHTPFAQHSFRDIKGFELKRVIALIKSLIVRIDKRGIGAFNCANVHTFVLRCPVFVDRLHC
jgi:hypothetical protein